MEIKIVAHDNGQFAIESGCCGPMSTIAVLRRAIAAIEQAAAEAETKAAQTAVAVPNLELQEKLLARGRNGLG